MQKIMRYVISGVLATVANLFATYAFTDVLGVWYLISSVVGFSSGVIISFVLQKFWTFRQNRLERVHVEAGQFILVALGGLAFNAASVFVLVEYIHVHYLFAQFAAGLVIAVGNFIFYHMIFRGAARRSLHTLWREELGDWERSLIIAGCVALFFLALKLFGVDLPYHQDEWKFARFVVDPASMAGAFYHPPLTEIIFRTGGWIVPPDLLRLIPLAFSALSFALLYLVLERRVGYRTAVLSLVILGTIFYETLAALMLDTDGAILPFFMLGAVYAYDRWNESAGRMRIIFGALLLSMLTFGFLIKLSFVLVIGALVLDYLYMHRHNIGVREIKRLTAMLAVFLLASAFLLWLGKLINPAFSAGAMINHALSYVSGFDRNWGQIAFQAAKAVMYVGPLMFAVVYISRETFEKTRFFFIYLISGALFYFLVFDFSDGALDKYLMFSIIPISAILGVVLYPHLPKRADISALFVAALLAVVTALLAINFLPHDVLSLYPKSAWAKEALTLHWNILLPFMGGSGPAGFYVSFLFVALSFAVGAALAIAAFFAKRARTFCAGAFLVLAFLYAGVFTEELFFGRINGSTPKVLNESLAFIEESENITSVITHNDIGAYELWRMDKYGGRFYAVPQYEEGHRERFASHESGQYLVVDIPRWGEESFYGNFFSSCKGLFETSSGAIKAIVYECNASTIFQK